MSFDNFYENFPNYSNNEGKSQQQQSAQQQTKNKRKTHMETTTTTRITLSHKTGLNEATEFLGDFNPEHSTRERRKLSRKTYVPTATSKSNALFDDKGRYIRNGTNVCDCLDNDCVGCHFPCPGCKSPKCGPTCRVNRKWAYSQCGRDGKDFVNKNSNI